MDDKSKSRRRSTAFVLAAVCGVVILLALLTGTRSRWIDSVPGISLEMSRPPVAEADLGPESAYRLLLRAIEEPPGLTPRSRPSDIWQYGWATGLYKVYIHPWPTTPPPTEDERRWALEKERAAKRAQEEAEAQAEGTEDLLGPPIRARSASMDGPMYREVRANDAPWTREQYENAQKIVKLYEPNMPFLDQALAAPDPQMPTAETRDTALPYLAPARNLARVLCFRAAVLTQGGDSAEGFGLLVKVAQLGNLVTRGGVIINHLVGRACANMATVDATKLTYQHDIPASVLKQTAREFLACADDVEPFVEALRAEARVGMQSVDLYYKKLALPPPTSTRRVSFTRQLGRYPLLLSLVRSNPTETRRNIRACYQHLVARELKGPVAGGSHMSTFYDALNKKRSKAEILLRVRDPMGILYANETVVVVHRERLASQARDAQLRGTVLFLAVMAYAKEKGHPPTDLKALVPDYLPHLPTDPFSGTEFLYLPSGVPDLPNDAWGIYSVGPDGKDDGGKADMVGAILAHRTRPGMDLVWPSQPYPNGPQTTQPSASNSPVSVPSSPQVQAR